MIYQIFYDSDSAQCTEVRHKCVTPCGVYKSRKPDRLAGCIYDDEKLPNLTEHNTLCEWRVLYYVWKHYPSTWVGFTSWRHDAKHFSPPLQSIDQRWVLSRLAKFPIVGFFQKPLRSLLLEGMAEKEGPTLKTQFVQWKIVETLSGVRLNDHRSIPLAVYHDSAYWDFVMHQFKRLYGVDIESELDWIFLGTIEPLHTWCNAFAARWDYFDGYMKMFTPIVLALLDRFGSHPSDLELAYICERLIILYNYIRFSQNRFN